MNQFLCLRTILRTTVKIGKNLLSISRLTADNNIIIEFHPICCLVKDKLTGKILMQGTIKDGLHQLAENSLQANNNSTALLSLKENWHRRLGLPIDRVLEEILNKCKIKIPSDDSFSFCEACQYGKSHLLPFKNSVSRAKGPLDLVHSDVWGPAPLVSSTGFRYYVHFIDDFSRFVWIFPLKQKSEVFQAFTQFKNLTENLFNRRIKAIQCDGGGEYIPVQKIAHENRIQMRISCPYTSAQNGRSERKHRHIIELGLTLLAQAKMPLHFWWEAFSTAVFLINRLPSPVTKIKTHILFYFKKNLITKP